MPSWRDVEQSFRDLEPMLEQTRLERQWDDAHEEWRIGGRVDLGAAGRFRAAAAQAGELIAARADVAEAIRAVPDAENRWFLAMWELGGPHPPPITGMASMHGRPAAGQIRLGRIAQPAKVAAALAAKFL